MSLPAVKALAWDVCPPPARPAESTSPVWLDEVVAFRSDMACEGGPRPQPHTTDGWAADADAADRSAYHVIASSDDGIVGCFRVLPLIGGCVGQCERFLGAAALDNAATRRGWRRQQIAEGGCWAVDPSYWDQGLGLRLLATGVAVAERLGLQVMVAAVALQSRQYQALRRSGWQPLCGVLPRLVPEFGTEADIVVARLRSTAPAFRALVDDAGVEMGLRLS